MDTKSPPPPQNVCTLNDISDYYYGMLLYYDLDGDDNCRWVVYNGETKVRCPTRRDALDYIMTVAQNTDQKSAKLVLEARLRLATAIYSLDKAATFETGAQRLLLERLAVRLKPVLVELDNILTLNTIPNDKTKDINQTR